MATFKPDTDTQAEMTKDGVIVGKSGVLVCGPMEAKVSCPKCGSPLIAIFAAGEPKYGNGIPGLECPSGNCQYTGPAVRRLV